MKTVACAVHVLVSKRIGGSSRGGFPVGRGNILRSRPPSASHRARAQGVFLTGSYEELSLFRYFKRTLSGAIPAVTKSTK